MHLFLSVVRWGRDSSLENAGVIFTSDSHLLHISHIPLCGSVCFAYGPPLPSTVPYINAKSTSGERMGCCEDWSLVAWIMQVLSCFRSRQGKAALHLIRNGKWQLLDPRGDYYSPRISDSLFSLWQIITISYKQSKVWVQILQGRSMRALLNDFGA